MEKIKCEYVDELSQNDKKDIFWYDEAFEVKATRFTSNFPTEYAKDVNGRKDDQEWFEDIDEQ